MSSSPLPELSEPDPLQAAAEERRRIARELHDSLGYRLTISMVQLENAAKLVTEEPQRAQEMIETVRGQLRSGLDDLRRMLTSLRNEEIGAASLLPSLQRLVSEFAAVTGIVVHTRLVKRLPALSDAQANALFRAAQEALVNSFRHGKAENVRVSLDIGDGAAVLEVKDDGRLLASSAGSGFGLAGMKERVDELGGSLLVNRPPEGGVTVTLNLPLKGEIHV